MTNKFFTLILSITILAFSSCSNDDDSTPTQPISIIIEGASVSPELGGPNEQNQVYVDLSTNTSTAVQRDSWDLAFYSGSDFRVAINGSIYMAAAQLTITDLNTVNSQSTEIQDLQPQVAVGTFNEINMEFVDAPFGQITETAIDEISDIDANNYVYLVNLGFEVGTEMPSNGSVEVKGDPRGWKKIRILKSNDGDYILQYADLDATSYNEVTISKNSDYNFTFFSFNTEDEVSVEPSKTNWDLNFTVFTSEIEGYGAYGYSDFVVNNTKASANAYLIDTEVDNFTYENFTIADVENGSFSLDQRAIGSSWRNGGGPGTLPSLKDNVFYIVNDTDGNLYKLKFLALTNESGERGHPEFVYSLLE